MKIKVFSLILTLLTLFSVFSVCSFATEEESRIKKSMNNMLEPNGEIIGISSKGKWEEYPENSIPSITEAAKTEIDFVAVDVKMTACGTLILFSDNTTERMLDSKEIYTVSEIEYSVLASLKLKNTCGGSNEKATSYSIPTLAQAIECAKENDIPLILRCSASIIDEITALISEKDALSMCIIMTDSKVTEIKEALKITEEKPYIIGSKKGNVIFNMTSFINGLEEISAVAAELKTGNRYGINFYPGVIAEFSQKMRIMADPTTPEISGYREDSETWWNDLISRGYSVIVTDHPELFCDYKERTEEARSRLQALYDKYVTNHTLPDFKDEVLSDLKKAYTDSVSYAEKLLSDNSSALNEFNDCYAKLFKAANDVNKNFSSLEDGSAGTTITLPRILLCVAAAVIVIVVQIYFFKRRKES